MTTALRLGMYGGAFDPPHLAHVAIARAAVEQLALDELRVVPTGDAWHRTASLSPAPARLAMTRIAFGGLPGVVIDDREIRRTGASYTIDTLRELRAEAPHAQLFLVMGEDQARAFTTWREWREIARIATLCVARRASTGSARTENESVRPELVEGLVPHAKIIPLQLPSMPDSATDVRERTARGEDVSSLVPPGIAGYIASHHLYQGH